MPLPQLTNAKKKQFLEAFSECASVTEACRRSGIGLRSPYTWREQDGDFAEAWEAAVERGTDALEDEAVRRAMEGRLEPVFYKGIECGAVRKFSDSLLMFLLRGRRPERYGDRRSLERERPELSIVSVLNAIDGTTRGLPSTEERRPTTGSSTEGLTAAIPVTPHQSAPRPKDR